LLTQLADMPEGSQLADRGRIDADGEIVMSQGALAALVGRSKPTVRRWLQDLERQQLILKSAAGKATRIRLQPRLHAANGDARH
jgi:DNA-binding IclR family transcriptional regulator